MKKTEWGMFVDVKTGALRLAVPKQKKYKPQEVLNLVNGALHFLSTAIGLFNELWKEKEKEK